MTKSDDHETCNSKNHLGAIFRRDMLGRSPMSLTKVLREMRGLRQVNFCVVFVPMRYKGHEEYLGVHLNMSSLALIFKGT